jgi:hypothetical protein
LRPGGIPSGADLVIFSTVSTISGTFPAPARANQTSSAATLLTDSVHCWNGSDGGADAIWKLLVYTGLVVQSSRHPMMDAALAGVGKTTATREG